MHAIALNAVGAVFDDIEAPGRCMARGRECDKLARKAPRPGFRTLDGRLAQPGRDPASTSSTSAHRTTCIATWRWPRSPQASTSTARSRSRSRPAKPTSSRSGVRRRRLSRDRLQLHPQSDPAVARAMIEAGELGTVHGFRGRNLEDYMGDRRCRGRGAASAGSPAPARSPTSGRTWSISLTS